MAASQKSSNQRSGSFLQAIANSLNHDYGIKAILHELEKEEWEEILIQISDYTALGATIDGGITLNLYKFSFVLEKEEEAILRCLVASNRNISPMLSYVKSNGLSRTTYWERQYDLANPDDFSHALHLIRKNVEENKGWPHTTRRQ